MLEITSKAFLKFAEFSVQVKREMGYVFRFRALSIYRFRVLVVLLNSRLGECEMDSALKFSGGSMRFTSLWKLLRLLLEL